MKTNRKIVAGLVGAILLVILGVVAAFWSFSRITQAVEARKNAVTLLIRADDLLSALKDAETGARGYALTGQESFLEPYLAVRDGIGGQLAELRRLAALSAGQKHIDALAPLIDARLIELARVIDLRRKNDMAGVVAAVGGGQGKRLMDAIRVEIRDFIQLEETALAEREARLQSTLRRLFAVLITGSVFALLFALSLIFLADREARQRVKNLVHLETTRLLAVQQEMSNQLRKANAALLARDKELTASLKDNGDLKAALEQRVIDRTAQLEAANHELEAFSYSVAHDLRGPLRSIDGFSRLVLEDFGQTLPEPGQRFLKKVRASAQTMGTLIDDLLSLARLSQQELTKQATDTNQLVRTVLAELGSPWSDRVVKLNIADLPASSADPALLKQVWVNLLSNALKYTRKRETAEIEIGCNQVNGVDTFFIRDNGTGFDMTYADKLFGTFQRLHSAEDFEGTGIGLAIVKRIILRHGGRVWAEAAIDRGATFSFNLEKENQP